MNQDEHENEHDTNDSHWLKARAGAGTGGARGMGDPASISFWVWSQCGCQRVGARSFLPTYSRMTLVSGRFLSPAAGEGDTEAKTWALDVLKPHPWHHYFVTQSIATCSPGETPERPRRGLRLGHIFEPFHWTPKSCEPRRHGRDPQTFWALHGRLLPSQTLLDLPNHWCIMREENWLFLMNI